MKVLTRKFKSEPHNNRLIELDFEPVGFGFSDDSEKTKVLHLFEDKELEEHLLNLTYDCGFCLGSGGDEVKRCSACNGEGSFKYEFPTI